MSLKTFFVTLLLDIRLQYRNGFYFATFLLVAFWGTLFVLLPPVDISKLLPALLLVNLLTNTFYFIAALILLEKDEGTLQALAITPLSATQYLLSKLASLLLLALAESLLIASVLTRLQLHWLPLVAGIVLAGGIFLLTGAWAISHYTSLSSYLLPSILCSGILVLPAFTTLFGWDSHLLWVHPLRAPLLLLEGSFHPLHPSEWIYGVAFPVATSVLLFHFSRLNLHARILGRKERRRVC